MAKIVNPKRFVIAMTCLATLTGSIMYGGYKGISWAIQSIQATSGVNQAAKAAALDEEAQMAAEAEALAREADEAKQNLLTRMAFWSEHVLGVSGKTALKNGQLTFEFDVLTELASYYFPASEVNERLFLQVRQLLDWVVADENLDLITSLSITYSDDRLLAKEGESNKWFSMTLSAEQLQGLDVEALSLSSLEAKCSNWWIRTR